MKERKKKSGQCWNKTLGWFSNGFDNRCNKNNHKLESTPGTTCLPWQLLQIPKLITVCTTGFDAIGWVVVGGGVRTSWLGLSPQVSWNKQDIG